jgi:hypothetical protein
MKTLRSEASHAEPQVYDWPVWSLPPQSLGIAEESEQTGSAVCPLYQYPLDQVPNMIRDPRFHRRGNAERGVNPAEVVERKPEAVGAPQVVPLL